MYYTDNTDWYTFNNNSFVPVFTDNIESWKWSSEEFKTKAFESCDSNPTCLYDAYVTGNLAIAENSKKVNDDSIRINSELSKKYPKYPVQN